MQKTRSYLHAAWGGIVAVMLAMPAAQADESPRLVITQLHVDQSVGARERSLLRQLPLVEVISRTLTSTRSFRVQVRDDAAVQALIQEIQVQHSPLSREGREKRFGLDAPDYILIPTLKALRTRTQYVKAELIAGMYERRDSGELELHVRVFDVGGNAVFERTVRESIGFGRAQEANEEQKQNNPPPPIGPIRVAAEKASLSIANAIIERTNPITVLMVRGGVLIIDRGQSSGFDENTVFSVHSKPEQVDHPTTGKKHNIPPQDLGEAVIVKIHEDSAELKLVKGDARDVPVGSIVRIVEKKP